MGETQVLALFCVPHSLFDESKPNLINSSLFGDVHNLHNLFVVHIWFRGDN